MYRNAKRARSEDSDGGDADGGDRLMDESGQKRGETHVDTSWTLSVSKATQRRVDREVDRLSDQHKRNGVFTVIIRRKAEPEKEPPNFEPGTGLKLLEGIRGVEGNSEIRLYEDCIKVAVNSVASVDNLMKVVNLGGIEVEASCKGVTDYWASITDVDPWISTAEIRGVLISQGVQDAKRVTYKRGDKEISSRRVLLKFKGIPPATVTLASRLHKVTADYGRPMRCFKCQKLGHKSMFCRAEESHCIKCGKTGHEVRECKQQARCAHCKGPHMATYGYCPVVLAVKEKRRILCEQKLQKQVEAKYQSVEIREYPQLEETAEKSVGGDKVLTYAKVASVARKLVARDTEGKEVVVNLGATRKAQSIPEAPVVEALNPKTPTRKKKTEIKKTAKEPGLAGIDVSSLLSLIRLLSPEVISLLKKIIEQLGGSSSKQLL